MHTATDAPATSAHHPTRSLCPQLNMHTGTRLRRMSHEQTRPLLHVTITVRITPAHRERHAWCPSRNRRRQPATGQAQLRAAVGRKCLGATAEVRRHRGRTGRAGGRGRDLDCRGRILAGAQLVARECEEPPRHGRHGDAAAADAVAPAPAGYGRIARRRQDRPPARSDSAHGMAGVGYLGRAQGRSALPWPGCGHTWPRSSREAPPTEAMPAAVLVPGAPNGARVL